MTWQDKKQFTPDLYKKATKKNIDHEHKECVMLAQWLRLKNILFTHIANERRLQGDAGLFRGAKLKAAGVSPGFPDYIIFTRCGVVFIEMKRADKKGKVSENQKLWIDYIDQETSYPIQICHGFDEAVDFISQYL